MAKNYAGLGISFFPVDKGAQKAIKEMTSSLEDTNAELESVGKKGEKAFSGLTEKLKGMQKGFGDNVEKMKSHARSLDTNMTLSSSLEGTFLSAGVAANKLGAQTGISAGEIKKATGFFHALNMDSDDLQKGFVVLKQAQIDVSNVGFGGLKDYAKFANVMGSNTEDLSKNLHNLRRSYNFTDKDLQTFIDTNAKGAQELGVAGAVFQNMGTIVGQVDEHFAKMNVAATPEMINKLTNSVSLLSGAFHQAGAPMDEVVGFSTSLTGKLTDVQYQMKQLASGASSDLPDLMKNLGMSMGDFGSASEALSDDPLKFVQYMSSKFGKMSGEQKEFFSAWSADNLGKDLTWLIANYASVADKVDAASASMGNAAGTAQELSKAYSAGRTQAEQYQLANDAFENRLFSLAKKSGNVTTVLKNQRAAHKLVGDELAKQVAAGGPIGALTQILISYKKMGLMPAIAATINLADQFPGVSTLIGIFGDNVTSVKDSLLGLLRGDISFKDFVMNMKNELMKAGPELMSVLKDVGRSIKDGFTEMFPDASKTLSSLGNKAGLVSGALTVGRAAMASGPLAPYVAAIGGIGLIESKWEGGIAGFAKSAVESFKKHFPKIANEIMEELPKFASKLGDSIPGVLDQYANLVDFMADYVGSLDWNKIGTQVGGLLSGAFKGIVNIGSDIIVGIFNMMTGSAEKNESTTGGKILNALVKMWGSVVSGLGTALYAMISGMLDSISKPLEEWLSGDSGFFKGLFSIYDTIQNMIAKISPLFTGMWDGFVKAGSNALALISATFNLFKAVVMFTFIAPIIRGVEDMVVGIFSTVRNAVSVIPDSLLPAEVMKVKDSIVRMDPEQMRITSKLGLDAASEKAAYKEAGDAFGAVVGNKGAGGDQAAIGLTLARMLSVNQEQLEEQKKQNSPDRGPLRPKSEGV